MFDIVQLGVEVIISTIVNLLGVFAIGIFLGMFLQSVFFIICFMTIRNYSGGYHATTRIRCNITLWIITLLVLICLKAVAYYNFSLCIIGILLSGCCLLGIGPLENKHKPLSANIRSINQKYLIILFGAWSVAAIVLYNFWTMVSMTIILTEIVISILLIIEKGRYYYEKKHV